MLLVGILLSLPALADDQPDLYDLSEREPEAGRTIEHQLEGVSKDASMVYTANGIDVVFPMDIKIRWVERNTTLEVENQETIRYRTLITVMEGETKVTIEGEDMIEQATSPIFNVPVIWQKVQDDYVPELEEGEMSEEQLEELKNKPAHDISLYPEDLVPLGHEWNVEGKDLAVALGIDSGEDIQGTATMKFVDLVVLEGREFAKIEISLSITQKMPDEELEGTEDVTQTFKIDGLAFRSLDKRLDEKVEAVCLLIEEGSQVEDGVAMTYVTTVPLHINGGDREVQLEAE